MLLEFTKTLKRILYVTPISSDNILSIDINSLKEGVLQDTYLFSYSYDDINWSQWDTIGDFIIRQNTDDTQALTTFVRILVDISLDESKTFNSKEYNIVSLNEILINSENVAICGVEYYKDTNIIRANNNSNIYNPYRGIDNAHDIRKQGVHLPESKI